MKSLTEIEAAITQLSEVEMRQLADWLQRYLEDAWDKQIEADAKSGRLDKLIQLAEADIAANRVKSLNEILDNC
ncbi:hypothetical protein [Sphaerospermopsis torques-reginae]|jgi:hypothetical protein|uniref:Addiction module component n=1 Tax=Sphaerospermopsis torques-reginae ITEP-024 TaxID=984208 RepID=A0ABX8WY78_9CYAN|nr:hypothetical protein [Sphaerospermopsis torques-reginae]QYX31406.1 hypothetical protein K2F26_21775 [Sphaerospermopsis torques-reginae ITEP-024]